VALGAIKQDAGIVGEIPLTGSMTGIVWLFLVEQMCSHLKSND
jgi:hypothetical protein